MFGIGGAGNALHPGNRALMPISANIFGCLGPVLTAAEKQFFRDADPWGFILFARNLDTPGQIRALSQQLRDTVGRDAPILIDQEGGRVARLRSPDWLEWMPALDQMAATRPGQGARAMWIRYRLIAAELRALGIDTNCAPVADIPTTAVHPIILNRCYGGDLDTVVAAARAVADGLLAGGVLPIIKHIPGHGRPKADSHTELPRTDAPADLLWSVDFAAFEALNDLPMAMTAHVVYEAFDANNCATLSARMLGLIRRSIGFDGLLISDDLSMQALSGTLSQRAGRARAAGCDIALHCNGDMAEMAAVTAASGALEGRGEARAGRALEFRLTPEEIDQDSLLAELDGLLMLHGDDRINHI